MKRISIFLLCVFAQCCFSHCLPKVSNYNFIAAMNGTMSKELACQNNKFSLKSHILVKVLFYKVSYDETAIGRKESRAGVISERYKVEDSRKSNVIMVPIEKDGVDLQSVPLVLGFDLAKKHPFPKKLKVFSEEGGAVYQFKLLGDEVIKTPLGILDTVKVFGEEKGGKQLIFWLWKKNYMMVKEDIREKGSSIFEAIISSQSQEMGCCWN